MTRIDRLLKACGFEEVHTTHGPARVGTIDNLVHQLQLASRYDHAYWEARLHSAVMAAVMNAYIDTGEVKVMSVMPPPTAGMAPPIDRGRMLAYTLHDAGILLSGLDVASDRIELDLTRSGELGPAWDADKFFPIAAPPVPNKPDYLRHDPTKNVGRRRPRKAYGRKGDRP